MKKDRASLLSFIEFAENKAQKIEKGDTDSIKKYYFVSKLIEEYIDFIKK